MFKYENVMTDSRITVMLVILGYILLFISFYSLPRSTDVGVATLWWLVPTLDNTTKYTPVVT
jgi:hypothetical protein